MILMLRSLGNPEVSTLSLWLSWARPKEKMCCPCWGSCWWVAVGLLKLLEHGENGCVCSTFLKPWNSVGCFFWLMVLLGPAAFCCFFLKQILWGGFRYSVSTARSQVLGGFKPLIPIFSSWRWLQSHFDMSGFVVPMASFPTSQAIVVGGGLGGLDLTRGEMLALHPPWRCWNFRHVGCQHRGGEWWPCGLACYLAWKTSVRNCDCCVVTQFLLVFFLKVFLYSGLCSGQVLLLWWKQHQSDLGNQWCRQISATKIWWKMDCYYL